MEKYGYAAEDDTPTTGAAKLKDPSFAVRKFQQFVGLPITGMFKLLLHHLKKIILRTTFIFYPLSTIILNIFNPKVYWPSHDYTCTVYV